MNILFAKCSSLISLPNISKWNTNNLKQLSSLFSDKNLLLSFPDLTKWNNYDEDKINSAPDYKLINELNNYERDDISIDDLSLEEKDKIDILYNDYEFLSKKIFDKFLKFYYADI